MTKPKIYTMTFASVYPLYIQKAERKNRTQAEVDEIIYWLTGYDEKGLQQQLAQKVTMETFFEEAPNFNENAQLIKGVICGYRSRRLSVFERGTKIQSDFCPTLFMFSCTRNLTISCINERGNSCV